MVSFHLSASLQQCAKNGSGMRKNVYCEQLLTLSKLGSFRAQETAIHEYILNLGLIHITCCQIHDWSRKELYDPES